VPNNGADGAVGGFAAADVLPAAHLLVVLMPIRSRRTQTSQNSLSLHRLNIGDGDRIRTGRGMNSFDVGSRRAEGLACEDVTHRIRDELVKAPRPRLACDPTLTADGTTAQIEWCERQVSHQMPVARPDVEQTLDWIPACAGMTELLDGLRWQCLEFALTDIRFAGRRPTGSIDA
jgi:hypothetical protein